MNFTKVLNRIKETKLISKDCDLVICREATGAFASFGWTGAIGVLIGARARSKETKFYVLAYENKIINLFDIDVNFAFDNVRYSETVLQIPINDIKRISVSRFLIKSIYIRTKQKSSIRLMFNNKFKSIDQKDELNRVLKKFRRLK